MVELVHCTDHIAGARVDEGHCLVKGDTFSKLVLKELIRESPQGTKGHVPKTNMGSRGQSLSNDYSS